MCFFETESFADICPNDKRKLTDSYDCFRYDNPNSQKAFFASKGKKTTTSTPPPYNITSVLENTHITPPKMEKNKMVKARLSVTENEQFDLEESFGSRTCSLPNRNIYNIKKGRKRCAKSTSLDEVDFSELTSNDSMEIGENRSTSDDFWTSANETFGLEWLFIDRKMCPDKSKVDQKHPARAETQTGVKVTARKRKASSLPRLKETNPAKIPCRRGDKTINRAHTLVVSPQKGQESCK